MLILTVLYVFLLSAWILPITVKVKRSVHMLQVNSYHNERYDKWMRLNRSRTFHIIECLYLIPLILWVISSTATVIFLSAIFVFALTFIVLWKSNQAEKRELVYKQRVQRLLATTFIIYGVIAATAIVLGEFVNLVIVLILLVSTAVLPFYMVRLANSINTPIEKKISEGFVNDAKRLLKASPDLKVIGITGSFGKTSVKHFVHAILSPKYNVLMTPESYNTRLGVTRTINEKLKPHHEIFIAEMGAKQEGDIEEICEIVHQQYGMLTAIGEQELETFKRLENIKKTKHEIVETLPEEDGVAILNKDDENIMSYKPLNACRKVYYGIERDNLDLQGSNIEFSEKGMSFIVTLASGEEETFKTSLLGKHNVYNILAALAIGLEMGLTLEKMVPSVKNINPELTD